MIFRETQPDIFDLSRKQLFLRSPFSTTPIANVKQPSILEAGAGIQEGLEKVPGVKRVGEGLRAARESSEKAFQETLDTPASMAFEAIHGRKPTPEELAEVPKVSFDVGILQKVKNIPKAIQALKGVKTAEELLKENVIRPKTQGFGKDRFWEYRDEKGIFTVAPSKEMAVERSNEILGKKSVAEARKFKSAEEFVGAQPKLYHGTSAKEFDQFSGINYFTKDPKEAQGFAQGVHLGGGKGGTIRIIEATHPMKNVKNIDDVVSEALIEGNLDETIAKELKIAQKEGYDTLSFTHPSNYTDGEFTAYVPVNNSLIKTKSQLTDFYNQVTNVDTGSQTYYHGTSKEGAGAILKEGKLRPSEGSAGKGIYLSPKEEGAKILGKGKGEVVEVRLAKDSRILESTDSLYDEIGIEVSRGTPFNSPEYRNKFNKKVIDAGYDAIRFGESELLVLNPEKAVVGSGDKIPQLYHGTDAENVAKIREEGFRAGRFPAHGYPQGVYFTTTKEEAKLYGDIIKAETKLRPSEFFDVSDVAKLRDLEGDKYLREINNIIRKAAKEKGVEIPRPSLSQVREYKEVTGDLPKDFLDISDLKTEVLKKMGYKGFIAPDKAIGEEIIIFDPKDITTAGRARISTILGTGATIAATAVGSLIPSGEYDVEAPERMETKEDFDKQLDIVLQAIPGLKDNPVLGDIRPEERGEKGSTKRGENKLPYIYYEGDTMDVLSGNPDRQKRAIEAGWDEGLVNVLGSMGSKMLVKFYEKAQAKTLR